MVRIYWTRRLDGDVRRQLAHNWILRLCRVGTGSYAHSAQGQLLHDVDAGWLPCLPTPGREVIAPLGQSLLRCRRIGSGIPACRLLVGDDHRDVADLVAA